MDVIQFLASSFIKETGILACVKWETVIVWRCKWRTVINNVPLKEICFKKKKNKKLNSINFIIYTPDTIAFIWKYISTCMLYWCVKYNTQDKQSMQMPNDRWIDKAVMELSQTEDRTECSHLWLLSHFLSFFFSHFFSLSHTGINRERE